MDYATNIEKDGRQKEITRKGYVIPKSMFNSDELMKIKEELTAKPFKCGNYSKSTVNIQFPLYEEDNDRLIIPRFFGIKKFGEPEINELEEYKYPEFNMVYNGELRPHQKTIVDKVFKGFEKDKGGLLIAGCGSGKTNMAIYIACHYKMKTLFIVNKGFLKNQVVNRILSTTNLEEVGIIQQNKVNVDPPFVVGMVQSLSSREYDEEIFQDFGMIIIDEVHHMGAKVFSRVYRKIGAKYMLGITAERKRNDRMYKIITWNMGPILHFEEQKPNNMVVVKKFFYKTSNRDRIKLVLNKFTHEPDRSTMITNLIFIKKRNKFILKLIENLYDQGKNILCLTGRLKQVDLFYNILNDYSCFKNNIGKYIGRMSEKELSKSATKQIIFGTYCMAEEGLDIENLNVVILCTPKSAIKQSVGRILRKEVYEEHPIVIDLVDVDNEIFHRQSNVRNNYYKKQNYNIQEFQVSDYEIKKYMLWNDEEKIKKALLLTTRKREKKERQNYLGPIDCNDIQFLD